MEGDKGSATFARLIYEQAEQLSSPPGLKVDYGWLVDRTVKQQYEDLRQLFARLKSSNIPEQDRSRHVIHFATHARAALIKLLVMLKWKQVDVDKVLPDGGKVGKLSLATGLDEWQDKQNEHNRQVRLLLDFFAEHLKTFQLQTPDVNTALDLLVNGDFKSGPQYLDSTYVPPKPLTAQGRSDTLQEMNELIAYRLQVEEDLPSRLQVVAIRDGKLYLRADRLFECAVTLGIVDPRKQWVMSDLRFLYVAKQDLKGKNAHPADIPHELKLHLCEMIDTQVLGSLYESRIATEASLGQDELLPRCKTFHKLFDVLQLLSLSHQLETLFQQAKELEMSEWAGNLRVRMAPDRKSFAMTYWSKPTLQSTNPSGRSSQSHGPMHGGEIAVRIARIASQDDDFLYGAAPDVQPAVFALEVDWHPEAGWLGINPGTKPVVDEDVFGVDPDDLDVEAILLDIVTFHAEQVTSGLKTFMDERLVSAGMFQADDVSVAVTELGSNVVLRIYDERWLKLQVNTVTGQLHIGEADATMASSVELRLATSSRLANIHTDKLLDVLVNTRTMLARDALEEKLRCLELHPYRDLGVSTQELDAHNLASTGPGQPMKPVLHAALPADPSKSVLLALHANSLTLAIVHFAFNNKSTNGVSVAGAPGAERRTIADMEWLNVADLPLAQQVGPRRRAKTIMIYDRLSRSQLRALSFELSLDDLQRIFAFCNAVVTTRLVAAQFTGRGMPPILDAEAVPLKMLASGLGLPRGTKRKLAIPARYMFPDQDVQGMISDVIDISIERGHGSTVRPSKITARLALRPKAVRVASTSDRASTPKTHEATGNPGWTVRLDTRSATASVSVETNTSRDYVDGLFDEFARVGMLLRLLAEVNRATETSGAAVDSVGLKILRYDLAGVWLEYRQGQSILLATPRHVQQQVYTIERLDVDLNDSLRRTVVALLQTVLDEQLGDGLGLGGFFQYAKLVSPCLEALVQAGETMSAELVVCTKRRWVLLWRREDARHGIAISFIMPGEFKEWAGGYLVSDAFSKEGFGLGHDVEAIPAWQEVVRRSNRADDRGDNGKYGIELDQGRDLAIEVGTREVVVFGRLLKEMGGRT